MITGQSMKHKPDKLSTQTKQLRETKDNWRGMGQAYQTMSMQEFCKAIRWRMAEEIWTYNEEKRLQALETNKGLKSIKLA